MTEVMDVIPTTMLVICQGERDVVDVIIKIPNMLVLNQKEIISRYWVLPKGKDSPRSPEQVNCLVGREPHGKHLRAMSGG